MQVHHHSREAARKARHARIKDLGDNRLASGYRALIALAKETDVEIFKRREAAHRRPKPDWIVQADRIPSAMESPYCQNFPLKSERVGFDVIKAALALNDCEDAQRAYGPFQVVCVCVYDTNPALRATTVAGGMIFTVNDLTNSAAAPFIDGTVHLSYTFVTRPYRHLGINGQLLDGMDQYARGFIAGDSSKNPRIVTVLEQNLAPKLSLRDFFWDCRSGLSPLERQIYWGNRGFEQIDIDYAHPSASVDHDLCNMLGVYVRGSPIKDSIRSIILTEHARRDFGIWYPDDRKALQALIEQVRGRDVLPLLPPPSRADLFDLERQIMAAKEDVFRHYAAKPDLLYEYFERRPISEWLIAGNTLTKPSIALNGMRPKAVLPLMESRGNVL